MKYSKLQIIEAGQGLARLWAMEDPDANIEVLDSIVRDVISVLEGELTPPAQTHTELVDIPGLGPIPVLGEIIPAPDGDNSIIWYNPHDYHPEQPTSPVKCQKCKTLTGFTDIDGDVVCTSCGLVIKFADIEALI